MKKTKSKHSAPDNISSVACLGMPVIYDGDIIGCIACITEEENVITDENSTEAMLIKTTADNITPKCKKILNDAYEISVLNGDSEIKEEYIILAICKEKSSVAYKILNRLGVDIEKIVLELQGK